VVTSIGLGERKIAPPGGLRPGQRGGGKRRSPLLVWVREKKTLRRDKRNASQKKKGRIIPRKARTKRENAGMGNVSDDGKLRRKEVASRRFLSLTAIISASFATSRLRASFPAKNILKGYGRSYNHRKRGKNREESRKTAGGLCWKPSQLRPRKKSGTR